MSVSMSNRNLINMANQLLSLSQGNYQLKEKVDLILKTVDIIVTTANAETTSSESQENVNTSHKLLTSYSKKLNKALMERRIPTELFSKLLSEYIKSFELYTDKWSREKVSEGDIATLSFPELFPGEFSGEITVCITKVDNNIIYYSEDLLKYENSRDSKNNKNCSIFRIKKILQKNIPVISEDISNNNLPIKDIAAISDDILKGKLSINEMEYKRKTPRKHLSENIDTTAPIKELNINTDVDISLLESVNDDAKLLLTNIISTCKNYSSTEEISYFLYDILLTKKQKDKEDLILLLTILQSFFENDNLSFRTVLRTVIENDATDLDPDLFYQKINYTYKQYIKKHISLKDIKLSTFFMILKENIKK